jgi:hypothetical protein
MKSRFGFLVHYYSFLILVVITGAVSLAFFVAPSSEISKSPVVPVNEGNNLINALPATVTADSASSERLIVTPDNISHRETTHPGDTIKLSSLKLVNNQWGAPASEQLSCAVFRSQDRNFGWYWNRLDPGLKSGSQQVLPIYPSLRIGGNHREQSDVSYFPVRLGDVNSLSFQVDYKYLEIPTGVFDFAYDMFLLNTDKSDSNAERKAEVMIWLHGTLGQPPETYRGDFSDGYNTYKLYSFTMSDGRLYSSFIMKGQPQYQSQHKVDVKKLLEYVDLDPNWYIPGIELGSEVVDGSGKIEISQFFVELNGSVIGP